MCSVSLQQPSGRFLSEAEREQIEDGLVEGLSFRQIAEQLDRAPSTISREVRRNMRPHHLDRAGRVRRHGRSESVRSTYRARRAQLRAEAKAARPKVAKLAGNQRLRAEVQNRLTDKHSPEQIARRLRLDFAHDPEMWVSAETIYQALYVQGRGALRRDLHRCLRTGRAVRKPRRRAGERRRRIPDMVNISERPPQVADRAVPGHWEGDLILGALNASAIGTLVERSTGFTLLLHLPDQHGALQVQQAMVAKMAQLPQILKQTLTWDQGMEMANHVQIAAATGLAIYFCDPASPWQRGTNENTNGLLRQYFPKGSDLSIYPADYLDYVAMQLNRRPRKRLRWQTPAEALDKLLSQQSHPPGVAMTG